MKYWTNQTELLFKLNRISKKALGKGHYSIAFLVSILFSFVCAGQQLEGVQQITGESDVNGQAVATDGDGNRYITGYFDGTVTFGEEGNEIIHASAGINDIFVAKYSPSGEVLWAKRFGADSFDLATDITVDQESNVYITGSYRNTLSFESATVPDLFGSSLGNVFVFKLNTDGEVLWAKGFVGTQTSTGNAIAVDVDGNVLTTGRLSGSLDFDPGPDLFELSSQAIDDVFISKLDPDGNFVWAKAFLGPEANIGRGIAVDQDGAVYTTGEFSETTDFDPGPETFEITSPDDEAVFIAKLDSQGEFVWAKQSAAGGSEGEDILIDGENNVVVSGRLFGWQDFDPGPDQALVESEGSYDGFVLKLSNEGDFIWVNTFGGEFAENAMSIDVDGSDNVYIGGFFTLDATVPFESEPQVISSAGGRDILVGKLNAEGEFLWAFGMGGLERDSGNGIAVDLNGNIHTIGIFEETADFGSGQSLTAPGDGEDDAFLTVHSQVTNTFDLSREFAAMEVYPNPAKSIAWLNSESNDQNGMLEILDIQGRQVKTEMVYKQPYALDVSHLQRGHYIIRFSENGGDRVYMGKLVVGE